ncbi:MAG: hypothetical protein ABEN55_19175, partial [Bradymonadaceae bacterium]
MDQKRFILAMVLSAGVILVWQMFFGPEPASPDQQREQKAERTADTSPNGDGEDETADGTAPDQQQAEDSSADQPEKTDKSEKADQTDGDNSGKGIGEPVVEEADTKRDVEAQTHALKTDRFRVELTNTQCGRVTSAEILAPDQYAKRGDLLSDFPDNPEYLPFQVHFTDDQLPIPSGATYKFVEKLSKQADDGGYKKIVYRFTDPNDRFHVDKVFKIS